MQIIKEIVFNQKMDKNSLSKSSEYNNTIDEPEFENVHSVAVLSSEAKAMGKEPYTVSNPKPKKDTSLGIQKALTVQEKIEEIIRETRKSNAIYSI